MLENPKVQPLEETFGFGHGDHPTYPFAEWDDGAGHRAVQGETFDSSPETFVRHARRWAHARSKGVLVRYERSREPVSVAFQFVPADHPLLTKLERDALRPAEADTDAGDVADADVVGDTADGELADTATDGAPGEEPNVASDGLADAISDSGVVDPPDADADSEADVTTMDPKPDHHSAGDLRAETEPAEPEAEAEGDATGRDAGRRRTGWRGGGR